MADQKDKPGKKPDIPGKKGNGNTKKPDVPPKKVDKGTGVSTPLDTKTKAALKVFEFVGLPKIPKLTPAAAAGSSDQVQETMDSNSDNQPPSGGPQGEELLPLNIDNTLDDDRRRSPLDESRYFRRGQSSQDDGYNSERFGGYDRDFYPRGRGRGRGASHDPWDYYPRSSPGWGARSSYDPYYDEWRHPRDPYWTGHDSYDSYDSYNSWGDSGYVDRDDPRHGTEEGDPGYGPEEGDPSGEPVDTNLEDTQEEGDQGDGSAPFKDDAALVEAGAGPVPETEEDYLRLHKGNYAPE
jgi:hypothetical protein